MTDTAKIAAPTSDKARRNRIPLDWINFLLADVQDGLGPFLAIYLLGSEHWKPGLIGMVMTIAGLSTVVARTPLGSLIDRIAFKRELIMAAAGLIGVCVAVMALVPHFWPVALAQAAIGAANAVFAPAIAGISLGIFGRKAFTRRVGRNESFNHAGNAFTAIVGGLCGWLLAPVSTLWVVAGLALLSIAASLRLHRGDIDDRAARGFEETGDEAGHGDTSAKGSGIVRLLRNRQLMVFAACITLFHFANAAMLPLAGEELARDYPAVSSLCMAACIIASQMVMVPITILVGRKADDWGRKTLFLVGFAALPIRGLLYTLSTSPQAVIAIQLLDGIGAGVFSVLFFVVVEDLTRGTGRYNLAIGLTSAAWGLGAAMSNAIAGYVAELLGYNAAFVMLSVCAAAAFVLFLFGMRESGPGAGATPVASRSPAGRSTPPGSAASVA